MSSNASDYADKVALITGAGSGIGRSTALHFARLRATVHAADVASVEALAERVFEAAEFARSVAQHCGYRP